MTDEMDIALNVLPFSNIADDQLRSMQTNLSISQYATNFDDLPLFDIFENLDDIFMENGTIDPDLNLRHGVQCECKYIDQSEVDGLSNDSSLNSFGMINFNIRSLQRNLDDLVHTTLDTFLKSQWDGSRCLVCS